METTCSFSGPDLPFIVFCNLLPFSSVRCVLAPLWAASSQDYKLEPQINREASPLVVCCPLVFTCGLDVGSNHLGHIVLC